MSKKHTSERIAKLDAVRDHQEIVRLLTCHVYPWDMERALEFALFRTFAVPSISGLLQRTGEFEKRPRKRYDDTELIMYELTEHGYDSERAKRAFRRMNTMHGHYPIGNEDFLYVLSTFIFEPIRWVEQYGWRKLSEHEKEAVYLFYVEVGKRMNIKTIPDSYQAFEQFNREYEKQHFKHVASNRKVGDATVNLLLSFYLPSWLAWMGRPVVYALMDDALLDAMGYPKPSGFMRGFVRGALRLRSMVMRYFKEPVRPVLGTARKRKTYPEGYAIEELGVFPQKEEAVVKP